MLCIRPIKQNYVFRH